MQAFKTLSALVAPLNRSNVDTDQIIPKQFLKSIYRTGFGPNLFDEWRYLDQGEIGKDNASRPLNKDFVLNQSRYQGAEILLTRTNFGCGSSREHAPWALLDYGFKVLIGPSFADIFYNNCFKNGILPVVLAEDIVDQLFSLVEETTGYRLEVDLVSQVIKLEDSTEIGFEIDPFRKECLLKGLDDIGLTLEQAEEIRAYEEKRKIDAPWLFGVGV